MNINWFPGHMTKSMRMIETDLKQVDAVIYVLDSRAPYSCLNPEFDKLVANKPIVYALNKADLGDISRLNAWTNKLSSGRHIAVTTVAATAKGVSAVLTSLKALCMEKLSKYESKGVRATVRAMVIGVPNTGKSTLINALCAGAKTQTGNRPGVTRGKQWVRVSSGFELLDTPGTLYPKLQDQTVAKRLAYLGSIRDEVVDVVELSEELMRDLKTYSPKILEERYKIAAAFEGSSLLEQAAKARGFILKGGVLDIDRAANAVLDDFRKGRLGKITFERAEDYDISAV